MRPGIESGNQDALRIEGGGPAGAAAALAVRRLGKQVHVCERARFPRHKVCGEFFSPEIEGELASLGLWSAFCDAGPARVTRTALVFGNRRKEARLGETAWGLSRYTFDALMLQSAVAAGAEVSREAAGEPQIVAHGRRAGRMPRGNRQFGFKAHFEGQTTDAVELYFFDGCYVGVSAIEGGQTNVCGLAPERALAACGWEFDEFVQGSPALKDRLSSLRRTMDWVTTGPLEYGQQWEASSTIYRAGDALSFVDPFTGSGLLAAVRSGKLAGEAAALGDGVDAYVRRARGSLLQPFMVASALRWLTQRAGIEKLVGLAPASLLFALTRPK